MFIAFYRAAERVAVWRRALLPVGRGQWAQAWGLEPWLATWMILSQRRTAEMNGLDKSFRNLG